MRYEKKIQQQEEIYAMRQFMELEQKQLTIRNIYSVYICWPIGDFKFNAFGHRFTLRPFTIAQPIVIIRHQHLFFVCVCVCCDCVRSLYAMIKYSLLILYNFIISLRIVSRINFINLYLSTEYTIYAIWDEKNI